MPDKNEPDPSSKKDTPEPSASATNPTPADPSPPATKFRLGLLLRDPGAVIGDLSSSPQFRPALQLAGAAAVCLLGFGFVIGTMAGGSQLWAAPLKVAGGALASALICLPSLYIFTCLTGAEARPAAIAGVLAACVCLASLLLVGFAPVAWLFAQSTDSTLFYGMLCLAFWGVALYFGFGVIRRAADILSASRRYHLLIWAGIFALVTIQMSTALRPIVGTAPTFLPTEKRFFLEHWFEQLKAAGKRTADRELAQHDSADPKKTDDGWE